MTHFDLTLQRIVEKLAAIPAAILAPPPAPTVPRFDDQARDPEPHVAHMRAHCLACGRRVRFTVRPSSTDRTDTPALCSVDCASAWLGGE